MQKAKVFLSLALPVTAAETLGAGSLTSFCCKTHAGWNCCNCLLEDFHGNGNLKVDRGSPLKTDNLHGCRAEQVTFNPGLGTLESAERCLSVDSVLDPAPPHKTSLHISSPAHWAKAAIIFALLLVVVTDDKLRAPWFCCCCFVIFPRVVGVQVLQLLVKETCTDQAQWHRWRSCERKPRSRAPTTGATGLRAALVPD